MKTEFIRKDIAEIQDALDNSIMQEDLEDIHRKIDCKYHSLISDIGMSMWGYNPEFGFNYEMLSKKSLKDNLASMKYKLEGLVEGFEENEVSNGPLAFLVNQIPEIELRFSDSGFYGSKRINDDSVFLEWAAKIQATLEQYPESKIKTEILQIIDNFDGWRDEILFKKLTAKLRALNDQSLIYATNTQNDEKIMDNKKVFVVHGRKEGVRDDVELFLRRIGLDPIILCNQPDGGLTIIEKIEENTDVGFAIVLYTDCDLGKLKEDVELKPRARQNVVFEHGYLIAKLNRKHVVALVESDVEIPGDLAGVIYISLMDVDWKQRVMRELQNCNIAFDWSKA